MGLIKQIGSTPLEKKIRNYISESIIRHEKKGFSKFVVDARYLSSNADDLSVSWPPELLATQPSRVKNYKSQFALSYVYAHDIL